MTDLRVGFGYDVHKLAAGYPLIIGGVELAYHMGSVAHSDGDVLIHAICDALLGAAHKRDIGYHFPDTDEKWRGADSKELLAAVHEILNNAGFQIVNMDSTVALQKPKLAQAIPLMEETLAQVLGLAHDRVSVKATTTEQLGFVGTGQGIAAYATVLIEKA